MSDNSNQESTEQEPKPVGERSIADKMLRLIGSVIASTHRRISAAFANDVAGAARMAIFWGVLIATLIALGYGAYLVGDRFPPFRVFNALLQIIGAALVFAYAVTSKNSIVHVAGFLVIATLVLSEDRVVQYWQLAFGDTTVEGDDQQKLEFSNISDSISENTSQNITNVLTRSGHLSLSLNSPHEYTNALTCMLEAADLGRLRDEVHRIGRGQYLLQLYNHGGDRANFRIPTDDRFARHANYLRMNRLIEFQDESDLASSCLTPRGCEIVRRLYPALGAFKTCDQLFVPGQCEAAFSDERDSQQDIQSPINRNDAAGQDVFEACRVRYLPFAAQPLTAEESWQWGDRDFVAYLGAPSFDHSTVLDLGELTVTADRVSREIELAAGREEPGKYVGQWIGVQIGSLPSDGPQSQDWGVVIKLETIHLLSNGSQNQTEQLDPYIYVLDGDGQILISENDDGGIGLNSQLTLRVNSGQRLLLGASEILLRGGEMRISARLVSGNSSDR